MDANQLNNINDTFKLRVIEAEASTSKAGNPMSVIDLEFIDNKPIRVKNTETGEFEEVDVNGLTVRTWITNVPQSIDSVNTFHKALGLATLREPAELAVINPELYKGQVGYAWVNFSQQEVKNSEGQAMINPVSGKKVTTSRREIKKWMTA